MKTIVAILVAIYFIWAAAHPVDWRFIDNANLAIHEAGHLVFTPFGEFISIAGGTALQLLVPALCIIYFLFRREYFSSSLLLFWFGENFLNISVYASDAKNMSLDLVMGGIHDWNYLLVHLGLIDNVETVGQIIRITGILIIIAASFLSILTSRDWRSAQTMQTTK